MAIILYFGVPGSGKSYEVVNSRVVPALKEGRRVVTNIRGLDIKLIQNYIKKNDKKYDIKNLGELVSVDHDLIQTADFFPYFDEEEKPVENTFVKRGDYIIIDEAWRFFPDSKRLSPALESFFAEHRHFSIDVILLNQTPDGISKYVRGRIESMFEPSNQKRIGFKGYVVHTYSGNKAYAKNRTTSSPKKFKKDIFELYNSYANGDGKETLQSLSVYKTIKFKFLALTLLLAVSLLVHGLWVKFTSSQDNASHSEKIITKTEEPIKNVILLPSDVYRISGVIKSKNGIKYVITDGSSFFPLSSGNCYGTDFITCEFNNQLVTRYTGMKETQ
ncbi:zonular occludens toxin domain-containing protein [Klebsiella pneumoniae]|uniref:zonular occludens toxin domain-containing protein n=1 Tax=Klebsiella pneumoniae TaxID=573 RepID=UPI00398F2152